MDKSQSQTKARAMEMSLNFYLVRRDASIEQVIEGATKIANFLEDIDSPALPLTSKIEASEVSNTDSTVKLDKELYDGERRALDEIIRLNKAGEFATRKKIAEIFGRIENYGNVYVSYIKPLVDMGYVEEKKMPKGKARIYFALKDRNGHPLPLTSVKDEQTGITHCPTGYAQGYGIQDSKLF